jgi:hypothetical protein
MSSLLNLRLLITYGDRLDYLPIVIIIGSIFIVGMSSKTCGFLTQ